MNLRIFHWILLFSILGGASAQASSCEESLGLPPRRSEAEVGREAAALFKQGERELAIHFQFKGGFYPHKLNEALAQRLREMALEIQTYPSTPAEFVALFEELAQVLSGDLSGKKYSRRLELGFVPPEKDESPKERSFSLPSVFINKARYLPLKEGLYYDAVFLRDNQHNFEIGHPETPAKLLALYEKGESDLHLREVPSEASSVFKRFEFERISTDGHFAYLIKGSRFILTATGEERAEIKKIYRIRRAEEVMHYYEMAKRKGISDREVRTSSRINGREKILIPARVVYKVQWKHEIALSDLIGFLKSSKFELEQEARADGTYFFSLIEVSGKKLRFVFKEDDHSYDRLILKTAYPEEVSSEQILSDLRERS